MARPNNSTLLLPFMAVLALIFPFTFGSRSSPPSGGQALHAAAPQQEHNPAPNPGPSAEPADEDLHNAKGILTRFFGETRININDPAESPIRRNYQLDFMFVTIPDPVDSRLPYLFDRSLTAIQRAAETDHYVLARFDLPWLEEIRARAAANSESSNSVGTIHDHHHEYETHPGYLLFRQEQQKPLDTTRALLVFLVGETPTTGIQKRAMINALDEASWLCGQSLTDNGPKDIADEVKSGKPANIPFPADCKEYRILGPSFSGSAQSLDFALHNWMESHKPNRRPRFRIVSGSATAVPTCSDIFSFANDPLAVRDWRQWHAKNNNEQRPIFAATVVRDRTALNFMLKFLDDSRRGESGPLHVALLTEGNTAYGASLRKKDPGESRSDCQEPAHFPATLVDLPFPLHISRLRSESERVRKQRESTQQDQQELKPSFALPLPTEDDSGEAQDSVPAISQLDVSSSELMLSNLLSTISREQFHYVGIAATDVRDVIFLAREVREHSPATVLFVLNADLVFSHPEAYPDTRGMLVVTPYPLFTLNQSWMFPVDGAEGVRIQFPDQGSEGIYNAALALLNSTHPLLEYASPFAGAKLWERARGQDSNLTGFKDAVPPLWIVTVGRDGFWPIAVHPLDGEDNSWGSYTLPWAPPPLDDRQKNAGQQRTNRGIVPPFTHAVLILWGFLCFAPALMFLARLPRPVTSAAKTPTTVNQTESWRDGLSKWLLSTFRVSRLLSLQGLDAQCFYLIGGTASLTVYAIAITAYVISAIVPPNGWRWTFLLAMVLIAVLGLAACGRLFANVLRTSWAARGKGSGAGLDRFNKNWFAIPIFLGVALCWACSVWLIARWALAGYWIGGESMITGFRAVNLLNGVSPLPPLFFIGLATVLWVHCSLRRVSFLQEFLEPPKNDSPAPPAGLPPTGSPPPAGPGYAAENCESTFFYSDGPSFIGLRRLEEKLRRVLTCPTLLSASDSRDAMAIILTLALVWGAYLFFYLLVFGFEARAFYWLLAVTFLLVVAGILSNVLRLYLVWRSIRSVLQRLGRLPMREAFTRFRSNNRTLPRMTLATVPSPLTALGISIVAADDLLDSAKAYNQLLIGKYRVTEAIDDENRHFSKAKQEYQKALDYDVADNPEHCRGSQLEAQRQLNCFTRKIEDILNTFWNASPGAADSDEKVEKARQELEEEAEEFLVSRTVDFLSHMFPQLTNLASYSMGCLFLMLMAISSYPLQPKNPFAYYCWFIIFSFVGVVLYMAVQMNRDAVLSCLNGTKPGEIHWDAGFIGRIVLLIVVPVLGLVGVQFPDTVSQILRWIAPLGSGHP